LLRHTESLKSATRGEVMTRYQQSSGATSSAQRRDPTSYACSPGWDGPRWMWWVSDGCTGHVEREARERCRSASADWELGRVPAAAAHAERAGPARPGSASEEGPHGRRSRSGVGL